MSIDYGMGQTNIDHATGIRYGVIPFHALSEAWFDASEADYPDPACPHCGKDQMTVTEDGLVRCDACGAALSDEDLYQEYPNGHAFNAEGITAYQSYDSPDIFLSASPFYTLCGYCSPCAPGAGYLTSAGTVRAYCFDHSWYESGSAPYVVYRVADNAIVPSNAPASEAL